jgi:hypothetical protein
VGQQLSGGLGLIEGVHLFTGEASESFYHLTLEIIWLTIMQFILIGAFLYIKLYISKNSVFFLFLLDFNRTFLITVSALFELEFSSQISYLQFKEMILHHCNAEMLTACFKTANELQILAFELSL